ncbi:MAG: hypothetical protein INR71_01380 [Terriglobus roseus]|nr:hypothetical protein [Terriglobus roseus]
MARSDQAEPSSDAEPAATSHRRRHVRRPTSDSTSSSENLVSEEDIQTEAAIRRNDSPSAALPIPQARGALGDGLGLERDVEGGSQGAEDSQLPSESPPLWRRLGNLGLPGFGRPAHERQRSDQSDRNR